VVKVIAGQDSGGGWPPRRRVGDIIDGFSDPMNPHLRGLAMLLHAAGVVAGALLLGIVVLGHPDWSSLGLAASVAAGAVVLIFVGLSVAVGYQNRADRRLRRKALPALEDDKSKETP
jgi:hypothetical protein